MVTIIELQIIDVVSLEGRHVSFNEMYTNKKTNDKLKKYDK